MKVTRSLSNISPLITSPRFCAWGTVNHHVSLKSLFQQKPRTWEVVDHHKDYSPDPYSINDISPLASVTWDRRETLNKVQWVRTCARHVCKVVTYCDILKGESPTMILAKASSFWSRLYMSHFFIDNYIYFPQRLG